MRSRMGENFLSLELLIPKPATDKKEERVTWQTRNLMEEILKDFEQHVGLILIKNKSTTNAFFYKVKINLQKKILKNLVNFFQNIRNQVKILMNLLPETCRAALK